MASEFGRSIKSARIALQAQSPRAYSLRSIAAAVDISPSAQSQIENGLLMPEEDTIRRLADALGLDVASLLTQAGRVPIAVRDALAGRADLQALVMRLARSPPEVVEEAIRKIDEGEW